MSRKDTKKTYEDILEKWSGILREGLPFTTAVEKIMCILEPYELQVITGENATQISRARNDDGSLKLSSLEKLYDFYKKAAKTPTIGSEDKNLVPIYSIQDAKRLINEGKDLKATIETAVDTFNRNVLLTLRGVKDKAPHNRLDVEQYSSQENCKKQRQEIKNQEIKAKIKQISVTDNQGKKLTLLTDDDKNYYLAPIKYSLNDMKKVLRYTGSHDSEYEYLSLEERYLLEFYTLVHRVSMDDKESPLLAKALDDPQAFWKLHAKYASQDNGWLRKRYGLEALKQTRVTNPLFNTIDDVKKWVERLNQYYENHKEELHDTYQNHSLNHIQKVYNIVLPK